MCESLHSLILFFQLRPDSEYSQGYLSSARHVPSTTGDVPLRRLFQPHSFLSSEAPLPTVAQRSKRRPGGETSDVVPESPRTGFAPSQRAGRPRHPLPGFVSTLVRILACGQCRLPCPPFLRALDPLAFQLCPTWCLILPLLLVFNWAATDKATDAGGSLWMSVSLGVRGTPSQPLGSSLSDGEGMLFASALDLPKGGWPSSREEATLGIRE